MTSLLARQGTEQSDGFRTRFAGRILCSEKATSATPSRRPRRQRGSIDSDLNQLQLVTLFYLRYLPL
ncbi:hypothetical protein B0O99DRAFT_631264 [Bisporella sp. PMI_857]|nr:hypothetical protein B0O99DRAFT_631264 [Bisporella sp. PMI_857]